MDANSQGAEQVPESQLLKGSTACFFPGSTFCLVLQCPLSFIKNLVLFVCFSPDLPDMCDPMRELITDHM